MPKNSGDQYLNWIIKGSSIVNSCTSNGIKADSLSIDMTGATPEATIQANLKSDEGGQKWIARSNDVVLSQVGYEEKSGKNANQTWIPHFVDKGYSLGLHPGFPGGTRCDRSGKWYMPLDMNGQGRTVTTPAGCQARCKRTKGCFYWNNFPNGGCHITTG